MSSWSTFKESGERWVPPPGLDRSWPRECRLTGAGKFLVILTVLMALGAPTAGVGLGMLATREAREARLMQTEGHVTEGRVTRLWRSRDKDRQPYVSYEFYAGGRVFERDASLPLSVWRGLKVGNSLPIRYLPADPEINHPEGHARGPLPLWVPFLVAAAMAAGSFFMTWPLRRQKYLLAYGRVAPARITSHGRKMRTQHGSELGQQFFFEFPQLSGAMVKGKAGPSKKPPAIGTVVPVLYDPDNPRRNAPYPLSLCKIERP